MIADIEIAIPEKFKSCCTACRIVVELKRSTFTAVNPTVGDQRCGISGRVAGERNKATARPADGTAVVSNRCAARTGIGEKKRCTTIGTPNCPGIVDKHTIGRRRIAFKNCDPPIIAASAARQPAIVSKRAISCSRAVGKNY